MPPRGRRALLLSVLVLGSATLIAASGCGTDGTTPDCTLPASNCGPDLDGAIDEAASEAAIDTGADAAETSVIDAPVDGPGDAKIDGDAGPG